MSKRTPEPAAPAPENRKTHPWARPALRSSDPLVRQRALGFYEALIELYETAYGITLTEGTKCAVAGLADTLESLPAMRERDRARAARDTLTGIGTCRRLAQLQAQAAARRAR